VAKPSSTKKVAKVARTGGGRTVKRGGQRSIIFPLFLSVVTVLGVFLIGFSRAQRQPDTSRPRIGTDHWHSAIAYDICGVFQPNTPDNGEDPLGIHTHGDGVIHTHPFSSQSAGRNATLAVYLETLDIRLTDNELRLPGQDAKKNGDQCPNGRGIVQMKVWDSRSPTDSGRVLTSDFEDLRLGDNQLITVAFLPEGAEIRKPPTEPELDRLSAVGTPAPTTTVAPTTTSTPEGSETTVAPTSSVPASSVP
jgi:hypothetical protein